MTESINLFDYADKYPNAPARGATETSSAAADIVLPKHKQLQNAVLSSLAHPGTWKDVSARLGLDSRSVQPRFSELKEMGLIIGTGHRVERCEVYRQTTEGERIAHNSSHH